MSVSETGEDPRDEQAVAFLRVYYQVCDLLVYLGDIADGAVDPGDLEERFDSLDEVETVVQALEDAQRTGKRLRDSPQWEAFLQQGPDALDRDLRVAIRRDVAPLADIMNEDIGLEPLDDATLASYLTCWGEHT